MQPKKVLESKYAAKDRVAAAAAAAAAEIDPNDPAAVARAQAEGEMRMFAADLSTAPNELDALPKPKTNGEFETYAATLLRLYGTVHKDSKQYKFFVKQVMRGLCDELDTDGIKDVETSLAGLRSTKLKAARESAAKEKRGAAPRTRCSDTVHGVSAWCECGMRQLCVHRAWIEVVLRFLMHPPRALVASIPCV